MTESRDKNEYLSMVAWFASLPHDLAGLVDACRNIALPIVGDVAVESQVLEMDPTDDELAETRRNPHAYLRNATALSTLTKTTAGADLSRCRLPDLRLWSFDRARGRDRFTWDLRFTPNARYKGVDIPPFVVMSFRLDSLGVDVCRQLAVAARRFAAAAAAAGCRSGLCDVGLRISIDQGIFYSGAWDGAVLVERQIQQLLWVRAGDERAQMARGVFWGNIFGPTMMERLGPGFAEEYRRSAYPFEEEICTTYPDGSALFLLTPDITDVMYPHTMLDTDALDRGAWLHERLCEAGLMCGLRPSKVIHAGSAFHRDAPETQAGAGAASRSSAAAAAPERPPVTRSPEFVQSRARLIEKVKAQGLKYRTGERIWQPSGPLPLVSLEDFFQNNDDWGSIAPNLGEHPGAQEVYRVLCELRQRPEVQDVLVEVSEVIEQDVTTWPYAERVYVITSATARRLAGWLKAIRPDSVDPGYAWGTPPRAPAPGPGMKVYGVWWD